MTDKNSNIETRISNRARSVFTAFGTIVNDFYLEAGIYFVGGFNAALVAWGIYTDLLASHQPLPYAIAIAIIAFVAVEGLAVYLVGAAARANNGLLWFFAVIFASFFTYAHYREMGQQGVIAQYITLAIPPFVVIGYWARTVKIEAEVTQAEAKTADKVKLDYQIEQARLNAEHQRQMAAQKEELKHAEKLARIEAKKVSQSVKGSVKESVKPFTLDALKDALQTEGRPNITQLAKDFDISRPTLYKGLNSLVDSGEVVKNGNGYEVKR